MVVGAKRTLESIPSKSRISVMRIQNFTVQKRHSVIKLAYGILLMIISIIMAAINPIELVSNWYLDMKNNTFLFNLWEDPPYQLFSEIWVYNYTNIDDFLEGRHDKLKLQELGPFKFKETRTNENMTIDKDRGVITMNPKVTLEFLRNESIAGLDDMSVYVPNIALISISTLAADKLGYLPNAGAYYSISATGSKLFNKVTVNELFWGYKDPLVSIANTILPGWIDFGKIGLLDRFYNPKQQTVEVELKNQTRRYSINKWNGLAGLAEQGFRDFNTSTKCNRVQGVYEGLMITPNYPKYKEIPIFRKQACRTYPFQYVTEEIGDGGYNTYKYKIAQDAFGRSSPYACSCTTNCLPDGFVDISQCYYGFPIALTKPHFLDADPNQLANFEGMEPNDEKDNSFLQIEPVIGAPISLNTKIQVNLAVRTSAGNPITKPLKDMVVPLVWLSMYCKEPPPSIQTLLRLRLVIGPPLVITTTVLLFIIGLILTGQGAHRIYKPRYKLIRNEETSPPIRKISRERKKSIERRRSMERRKSSVILNFNNVADALFKENDDLAKEAVSLLAITEDDNDDLNDIMASD